MGSRRLRFVLAAAGLIALAMAIPAMPVFWITLLNYIGMASLVALGLVLLTGVSGLTSFGQAAFAGIGAYVTGFLTLRYGVSPWLTLPAGLLLTGAIAWTLGFVTLRLSGHYLALATIAWGISLYYLFGNIEFLGKFDGLNGLPAIELLGFELDANRGMFILIWVIVGLACLGIRNLLDSRPGRAIRALKGGSAMAEAFGVDTARYKTQVFIVAALLAGASGWLYAHLQRSINPSPFGINAGIEYLFMAVVGGAAHVSGAIIGAGFVILAKDQLQDLLPRLLGSNANYEAIVFGVLLVLLLQHAPSGLWPYVRTRFGSRRKDEQPASRPLSIAKALRSRLRPAAGTTVLELLAVRKAFGGLVAVNDISFDVSAGEIVGLIGPNGAGKSTTFNLVTGVLPVTAGEVRFLGERIDGLPAREVARRGVGRTFQHVQLLPAMSVLENVALGAHLRAQVGLGRAALRLDRTAEAQLLGEARRQLRRVGLDGSADMPAGDLALGQQRLVEIARALASDPVLLMLDEPAAGLRYQEKQQLAAVLRQLRSEGMSVLLVEHDMQFVMQLTNRLVVMDFGSKLAEGDPDIVRLDPVVLEAYLGGIDDDLKLTQRVAA